MPQRVYVANELRKYKHYNPTVSQEELAFRTRVARGTLQAGWRGQALKEITAAPILRHIRETTPSDWRHWQPALQQLWIGYADAEEEAKTTESPQFRRYITNLQHLLEGHRAINDGSEEAAAYVWMRAWTHHDLAFRFKVDIRENIRKALASYERSIHILRELDGPQYRFLATKAELAQFATFYMSKPESTRKDDWGVLQWIKNKKILDVAYECACEEPYAWRAMHAGLVCASLMKNKSDCDEFHRLLIAADPNFAFLDYAAPGVEALKSNTDLSFFLSNLNPSLVKYRS